MIVVETWMILFGLLGTDFIIAWVIRQARLQNAFAVISIIAFILPLGYSILEWNIGIQNGTYTISDLDDRIISLFIYGLGFAFTGGVIGYLVGGYNTSSESSF